MFLDNATTNRVTTFFKFIIIFLMATINAYAAESFCPDGSAPAPGVIWCDSFEDADLGPGSTVGENYFDFSPGSDTQNMVRTNTESIDGNYALQNHWDAGAGVGSTGSFMRTFGRNPVNSQSHSSQDFDSIYWRIYVKLQDGFSGQPNKLTRAFVFAESNWAQAMIAHVWSPANGPLYLDPASGVNLTTNLLETTGWNQASNYLGQIQGSTTMAPDTWYCVEVHAQLNTPGQTDGVFEFWRDDVLQGSRSDLNWRGSWDEYGINTVMISDYWNETSPKEQARYLDALVISTQRIGCLDSVVAAPNPPSDVSAQ